MRPVHGRLEEDGRKEEMTESPATHNEQFAASWGTPFLADKLTVGWARNPRRKPRHSQIGGDSKPGNEARAKRACDKASRGQVLASTRQYSHGSHLSTPDRTSKKAGPAQNLHTPRYHAFHQFCPGTTDLPRPRPRL